MGPAWAASPTDCELLGYKYPSFGIAKRINPIRYASFIPA